MKWGGMRVRQTSIPQEFLRAVSSMRCFCRISLGGVSLRGYPTYLSIRFSALGIHGAVVSEDLKEVNTPTSTHFSRFFPEGKQFPRWFPRWLSGKESAWQSRRCWKCGFDPWVWKIPCRRKWQPTPAFLPGKFMNSRAWWAIVQGVAKSQA